MSATGRSHTAKPAPSLEQLMITKYSSNPSTMYPAHGFARGGIGTFVATGAARSGINQLPQSVRHARSQSAGPAGRAATANSATALLGTSRPASGATSRYTLSSGHEAGATGAGGTAAAAASHWSATFTATGGARNSISFSGSPDLDEEGGPEAAAQAAALQQVVAKEWEKGGVAHLADFQTATRRSRIHDVPGASKWAGLSFYETGGRAGDGGGEGGRGTCVLVRFGEVGSACKALGWGEAHPANACLERTGRRVPHGVRLVLGPDAHPPSHPLPICRPRRDQAPPGDRGRAGAAAPRQQGGRARERAREARRLGGAPAGHVPAAAAGDGAAVPVAGLAATALVRVGQRARPGDRGRSGSGGCGGW